MKDDVPREVKEERNQILLNLQQEISLEKNREVLHKEVEVLVEGEGTRERNKLTGRTRTNKIVLFEGENDWKGNLVDVTIRRVTPHALIGCVK
jgi:tRNA-2-methylthio-N6-dimethylallyladenosine synthase